MAIKALVVDPGDECIRQDRIGMIGEIVDLNFDHACGNIKILDGVNFTDPFITMIFEDGVREQFWIEEIELVVE